jgi:hypothetical protein
MRRRNLLRPGTLSANTLFIVCWAASLGESKVRRFYGRLRDSVGSENEFAWIGLCTGIDLRKIQSGEVFDEPLCCIGNHLEVTASLCEVRTKTRDVLAAFDIDSDATEFGL